MLSKLPPLNYSHQSAAINPRCLIYPFHGSPPTKLVAIWDMLSGRLKNRSRKRWKPDLAQ